MEGLLRDLAPQVLGALVRRHGQFDACEDAVQEALLAATVQWPAEGVPERPRSWLLTVATRTLVDHWRTDSARRRRESTAALDPTDGSAVDAHDTTPGAQDTLVLLFLCCHPALSPPSQLALTLRAVGGLSTAQIAAAFLVPQTTMAQRIGRAKQRIRDTGARFVLPPPAERAGRLGVVLHVLYLVFNEGHTASSGPDLHRADLTAEAIRLTRLLHRLLPGDGEVAGLLALMLLTDARRTARTEPDGSIVPLAEQRRERWDAAAIAEGQALLARTLGAGPVGQYQIQAAIAALHDEASVAEQTDWPQILALYDVLAQVAPGPMVTLSRAVALAMVHGPVAGLAVLGTLDADDRLAHTHRVEAVRGHLLEQSGDRRAAHASYLRAARMTASLPEQRYLTRRAALLRALPPATDPTG
jgi:RNA polymerase sigma factor (sigma-70 family)